MPLKVQTCTQHCYTTLLHSIVTQHCYTVRLEQHLVLRTHTILTSFFWCVHMGVYVFPCLSFVSFWRSLAGQCLPLNVSRFSSTIPIIKVLWNQTLPWYSTCVISKSPCLPACPPSLSIYLWPSYLSCPQTLYISRPSLFLPPSPSSSFHNSFQSNFLLQPCTHITVNTSHVHLFL